MLTLILSVQDSLQLNTPAKLKRWLTDHDVQFDADADDSTLRTAVVRRIKRLRKEAMPASTQRSLFKESIHLTAFIELLNDIRRTQNSTTTFKTIVAVVDDISPDVVKDKHAVGKTAACTGMVYDGKCYKCNEIVKPVRAFSFTMILRSVHDASVKFNLSASHDAGVQLFMCSPEEFDALSPKARDESGPCVHSYP